LRESFEFKECTVMRKSIMAITAASALIIGGSALAQEASGDGAGGIWAAHKSGKGAKPAKTNGAKSEDWANAPAATDNGAAAAGATAAKDATQPAQGATKPAACVASPDKPCPQD
jgi:hypothetical protein